MDIYREQILDHYRHPHNWGLQEGSDVQERGYNSLCGDEVTVQLSLNQDSVQSMRFEGKGCAVSMAAASLLSDYVTGKSVEEVRQIDAEQIQTLLGTQLPPVRLKCGLLALKAVQLGLEQLYDARH